MHVDDIILARPQLSSNLSSHYFNVNLLWPTLVYWTIFLVRQTSSNMFLSQSMYATTILERHACWIEIHAKLQLILDNEAKGGPGGPPISDITLHGNLIWALEYVTFMWPHLSYVVCICFYLCMIYGEPHFVALKWVLRYVHGTIDHWIQLYMTHLSAHDLLWWRFGRLCYTDLLMYFLVKTYFRVHPNENTPYIYIDLVMSNIVGSPNIVVDTA